jgi:uncharacterized protein (TIGR03435 family)
MKKTILLVSVVVLVLATAVAVKIFCFPSVDDKYFLINPQRLRQVPPGFAVVRPTHFPNSPQKSSPPGMMQTSVNGVMRMVGRNVPFQQLIAVAYGHNPGRITLPPDAPKGNFDYLVTMPKDPLTQLQSAIRRKLGYTAEVETLDTPVLALKIENPALPGLKVSAATQENVAPKNGRLYFTHAQLSIVTDGLEGMLKTPVVDQTGLTNFYDFSLAWDAKTQREIQTGTMDTDTGSKILAEWGLGLEPDTASLEMLVVKKVK